MFEDAYKHLRLQDTFSNQGEACWYSRYSTPLSNIKLAAVGCGEELKIQGHLGNAFQLVFVFAKRLNYR